MGQRAYFHKFCDKPKLLFWAWSDASPIELHNVPVARNMFQEGNLMAEARACLGIRASQDHLHCHIL
jgi:hypothetical protein